MAYRVKFGVTTPAPAPPTMYMASKSAAIRSAPDAKKSSKLGALKVGELILQLAVAQDAGGKKHFWVQFARPDYGTDPVGWVPLLEGKKAAPARVLTLGEQEKDEEALLMKRECYSTLRKVQGVKHPNTLTAISTLADTLVELGEYAEGEAIYRETLVLQKEVLGAEHDHTKMNACNIQGLIDSGHASIQTMPV